MPWKKYYLIYKMEKQHSKYAIYLVLMTICIDSIGLGIIIPSLPKLIAELTNLSVTESSKYSLPVVIAYAGAQFLFSPLIGNLSDRFGRRPIILMSLLGLGIDFIFMYFAPDLAWLIVGRLLSGMFGASFTTAAAYIADISTDENRAQNFGMIGAAFGLGFIIGPAIGGLVAEFGLRIPFLIAAFFSVLNFVLALLFLKESLPTSDRRKFSWARANPVGALIQIVKFPKYRGLFLVTFLVMLANMSLHSIWNYFTIAKFKWDLTLLGLSLAAVGVCFGLVQAIFAGKMVTKYGNEKAAKIGLILAIVSFIGFGMVPYGWMIFLMIIPYAFSGIFDPAIRSLVSGQVPANEQGELQGIFTSLMSLAEIFGPSAMIIIFYKTAKFGKTNPLAYGSAYFVSAVIGVIALLILAYTFRKLKRKGIVLDEVVEKVEEVPEIISE